MSSSPCSPSGAWSSTTVLRGPRVRRTARAAAAGLVGLAAEALYGQALLLGYHPIRPADAALLNRSFLGLLDRAVPEEPA